LVIQAFFVIILKNKVMSKNKIASKNSVKADGTIAYVYDGKLHNWDGPALIPEGDKKLKEYYLYGIQYTEEEWKDRIKDQTGLPFYKQSSFKGSRL